MVLGAGLSGISAARRLQQLGVKDVVVLEARERVGGRVHTDAATGWDLGASWLYTPDQHPLWQQVSRTLSPGLGPSGRDHDYEWIHALTTTRGLLLLAPVMHQSWSGMEGPAPRIEPFPDATDTMNCRMGNTAMRVFGADGKELPADLVARAETDFNSLLQQAANSAAAGGEDSSSGGGEGLGLVLDRLRRSMGGREQGAEAGLFEWNASRIEG